MFIMVGAQSISVLVSMMTAIEHHTSKIVELMQHMNREGLATVEATAEGEARWVDHCAQVGDGAYPWSKCDNWCVWYFELLWPVYMLNPFTIFNVIYMHDVNAVTVNTGITSARCSTPEARRVRHRPHR